MRVKVTEQGVLIPKHFLEGIDEVDIRKEQNIIFIVPVVSDDPIFELGRHPVSDKIEDASEHHDCHLYSQQM